VTHPPCASIGPTFSPLVFFFPNDLFSDWFSFFIVHLCSFSKFSSIALIKNFYFRSLIPRHFFYPYASHWSTTPLISHWSTTLRSNVHRRVLVNLSPYDFYTLSSMFICTYHPFDSIVLFVLSQLARSFWFSIVSS
jgi:hypothetical protein